MLPKYVKKEDMDLVCKELRLSGYCIRYQHYENGAVWEIVPYDGSGAELGGYVCRSDGNWVLIGYVEGPNHRLAIRAADAYVPD